MRKFWIALATMALVVVAAAPAGASVPAQSKGPLKVGTNLPAPGFWTGNTPSDIDGGFEYELAQEIAKKLGYDGSRSSTCRSTRWWPARPRASTSRSRR